MNQKNFKNVNISKPSIYQRVNYGNKLIKSKRQKKGY